MACPLSADGTVDLGRKSLLDLNSEIWKAPRGDWRVIWFLEGPTMQRVKRPSLGAEGLVLDHFDGRGFAAHAAFVGEALSSIAQEAGAASIRAMFCDSWEVYEANWSRLLLPEFRNRRGYDLADYLPALWMEVGTDTGRIRWDYRRTLSELALEQFFRPFAEWCEEHGFLARVQAHGTPADLVEAYGTAHIPEGESYGPQVRFQPESAEDTRVGDGPHHRTFAASAAAIFDRPVCSCESYTWLRNPRFQETLEDIKAATDIELCEGINQIVCHGYSYSPPEAGTPGWVFYAASQINHNNTWWPYFRRAADYIARACWLLRQGKPASDLCIYVPTNDAWAEYEQPPRSAGKKVTERLDAGLLRSLREAGYQYDFVNDACLADRSEIRGSVLAVGAAEYRGIVVPSVKRIDPSAMKAIRHYAGAGGAVVFAGEMPTLSCSLMRSQEGDQEVTQLCSDAIQSGALRTPAAQVGDALRPHVDPSLRIDTPDCDVGFRHRRAQETDIYFVANVSPHPKCLLVALPEDDRPKTIWDPETGMIYAPTGGMDGGGDIPLTLREFQSVFIIACTPGDVPRSLPTWPHSKSRLIELLQLDKEWSLQVSEDASPINLTRLVSWTELPTFTHYSGSGLYRTEFEIEQMTTSQYAQIWLELGEVREVAEVSVNEFSAGVTWKRPHILDITQALRPGRNCLEIRVTNLLINRVLGQPDPDYSKLHSEYGARFGKPREKELCKPVPSGLLGPVRIVAAEN